MKTIKITISAFFFICLFNVAFIPQLCLDAVEDLQSKVAANNIQSDESNDGLNIFEEESKESSEETSQDENQNDHLKELRVIQAVVTSNIHQSLVNTFFASNHYQSLPISNITPPPKV